MGKVGFEGVGGVEISEESSRFSGEDEQEQRQNKAMEGFLDEGVESVEAKDDGD